MSSTVMQVSSNKSGELAKLVAGVLLVVASAVGAARDMDQPITLGAKPGIASGSNVIELGAKPGIGSGSNVVAVQV